MNNKILFNEGWEFAKSGLEKEDCKGLKFEAVDLPHDWLIYDSLKLYGDSIGWYRKKFIYSKKEKELLLFFEGVYMDSALYVNGKPIGQWKYGYSSFEHDITEAVAEGENEILLKVVHQGPNSRWYSGAGIYRNVWLKTRDKNHIVTDGIYVSIKHQKANWKVEIDTEVKLYEAAEISHSISYKGEVIAASSEAVEVGEGSINTQCLRVEKPLLWSTDAPNLYQLKTELYLKESKELIEVIYQNIGFREIVLDSQEGFKLNGTKMKLNGVCEHHDLGALGAAFNKAALRRRFLILKDMGVNAVRTSHNMPAPELMELADELGMLILSEAFDMWEKPKTPYDYARFFKDWAHKDVKSWIRRDRNHPSLIMWSIGNEIYDTHAGERGQEITKMLMDYVREYDPKENAKITIGSNFMPWENAQKCADIVKVAGYNYAERYYEKHHQAHADWVIYGSETGSVVQSRGIYHFPYAKSVLADDDEQCSSLGNSTTSWGAKSPEACILAERDTPFSLGQFIWTGVDYIGEPTPYHTKNSYFGQIDTATFKKDSYYIYQAEWTDYRIKPMVHLFPYWDFNVGQLIDVRICSNAPKVELFINGASLGSYNINHEQGRQLLAWYKVPYEPGEIKAVAYDEKGKIIATELRSSFEDAEKVCLTADKKQLTADGRDLIFVEITMKDKKVNLVENANNRVTVKVTGAGRLLGLDNGDSTDYDQYKGTSRRLFSGKLMAIIGASLEAGDIHVEVSSKGMESESLDFQAVPAEKAINGISAIMKNSDLPCVMGSLEEIPLRKIEIISSSGQLFNENLRELYVEAKLYPENTSYKEIEWSAVNASGIVSNIAKVEALGAKAKITALGDGEFRVRCTSKNGSDKTKLISQLEFKAEGLGTAFKDPYTFISAGLYDYSNGEVGNGNERGVATSREGETQVGFHGIDFGAYGSDTITLPIFALSNAKYSLQIWEGMPGEEKSSLLADVIYQKESIWNVYQEETYKLSKKLKGITSICFVLHDKVHIKGFYFEKKNRAFQQNRAVECDHIYGDTFTLKEDIVQGIGNNVSLEFESLDFTAQGASKLVIYGNSPIDKNTIHIQLDSAEGSIRQIVEFTHSNGYEERIFELEKIEGAQKVTFVFLPGSNFDFGWFRFEN
ncbi:DUF4982 domain-containing protein [Clostridium sp. 19966]|uniref:glycoside hydrolase family 2 TIM barrel-domain containing protein n=1 Tax=Clostridium sp. 19966 TaxID=2768166 RepID=UPI0028E07DA5|nr:glycoside hydrolase family 2 TIM barrel-domain containing protein [Clostridium sp. 19966]MDT8716211.1 DUF4982 domain-containing protein [Clostridium sp. 19966]